MIIRVVVFVSIDMRQGIIFMSIASSVCVHTSTFKQQYLGTVDYLLSGWKWMMLGTKRTHEDGGNGNIFEDWICQKANNCSLIDICIALRWGEDVRGVYYTKATLYKQWTVSYKRQSFVFFLYSIHITPC